MALSKTTRSRIGVDEKLPKRNEDLDSALGARVTVIPRVEMSKAEQALLRSEALEAEDSQLYGTLSEKDKQSIIIPPFNPLQLATLVQQNNTLNQCINAMEVNIDGTGWTLGRVDEEEMSDEDWENVKEIEDFFNEPFPRVSLTEMRRAVRRDLETLGYAFIEVIRDSVGRICFMRHLDAKITFVVKYDEPVPVRRKVMRRNEEVEFHMEARERRYAQVIGQKLRFFREFGASRQLNKYKGQWESKSVAIKPEDRASDVLFFRVDPDVLTPYGVPRWVNQIPSVLGSREAEIFNLEFFKHGGLPPVLILVQGGALSREAKDAITQYLSGKAALKQRGMLAEVYSTSGDLSASNQVRVTVERFGGDRQRDSMFEGYDDRCAQRVRQSFRISEMFLGKSSGMSFSTAYTAYMLDEAQVFKPERDEFDHRINVTIMRELAPDYTFRSLPLTVKDVQTQLNGLGLAKDMTTRDSFMEALNEVTGLHLQPAEEPDQSMDMLAQLFGMGPDMGNEGPESEAQHGAGVAEPQTPGSPMGSAGQLPTLRNRKPMGQGAPSFMVKTWADENGLLQKVDDCVLIELADDWADMLSGTKSFSRDSVSTMGALVKSFSPPLRQMFNGYVAQRMSGSNLVDEEDTIDLLAAAGEALLLMEKREDEDESGTP